jgi:ADP-ribose pyrophosphatase YjhB (NUDIX family)
LPGGGVEIGETLSDAVTREAREETGIEILPVAFAGHREVIVRDASNRTKRHFVVMCFAARWLSGEPTASAEVDDVVWRDPSELSDLPTTEGLAEIVARAAAILQQAAP